MKKIFLLTLATILFSMGSVQARQDVRRLSCAQAQNLVQRNGAVVLTTGQHTFRRFVRDRFYCDPDQIVVRTRAPSRDNPRCVVGYTCSMDPWDGRRPGSLGGFSRF
ncbi:MAG: hypothetical protein ABJN26_06950 [Stappiaceae bacterium]